MVGGNLAAGAEGKRRSHGRGSQFARFIMVFLSSLHGQILLEQAEAPQNKARQSLRIR